MRYVSAMLFLILFSTPVFSDEQADIRKVEVELRLEKEARDIYKRADERAIRAVNNSSLGKRERAMKLEQERQKREFDDLAKKSNAIITRLNILAIEGRMSRGRHGKESVEIQDKQEAYTQAAEETLAKMKRSQKEAKKSLREYKAVVRQMTRIERKITSIFLADEIRKLRKKKSAVIPEIERLMKQKKAEVI